MKTKIILCLLCACGCSSTVLAKRAVPPDVPAVVQNNIQYFPCNSPAFWMHCPEKKEEAEKYFCDPSCIKAWDIKTDRELWTLQIYSIEFYQTLESDIQDICIKQMYLQNGKLLVINERNDEFIVDLQKRTVFPDNKIYRKTRD